MDSRVEIVADVTEQGRTVLTRLKAQGQLAVRRTAPGTVHLVGTAAGPLGGDVVEVSVLVRSGASLVVAGVAASLALPGRSGGWAESSLDLTVEDGARLVHALPPLVVCRRAQLRTTIRLALAGSAAADVTEQVVFGRHGEPGGDWIGRIMADHDHRPVLRTTQRSAVLRPGLPGPGLGSGPASGPASGPGPGPGPGPASGPASGEVRALVSRLSLGPGFHQARSTSGNAVACPLGAGGVLVTSVGPDLSSALADIAVLDDQPVPAGID